jgi:hypothetical protein
VGPYGNTWVDSPTLNRLASESLLFETAIADTVRLDTVYRSYWQGVHAVAPQTAPQPTLLQDAKLAGIDMVLLTDADHVAQHPLAVDFSAGTNLARSDAPTAAHALDETRSGQLFAAAIDELVGRSSPYCLWLHADAMNSAWDAPYAMREALADDDDPPPPTMVIPPNYQLDGELDPDELLGLSQAYGAEVAALDRILDAFLDAIAGFPNTADTLLVVTSPRGFALGEHGNVGACGDKLFGEILQVPLLVRFPDHRMASQRCASLVQPSDVCATLYDWFGLETPEAMWGTSLLDTSNISSKRCAVAVTGEESALRTPIWHLRSAPPEPAMLFAKPDDRWEVNEVADRCADVVAELATTLDSYRAQANSTCLPCLPQISDDLVTELG